VNTTLDNLTAGDGKLTLREAIVRANIHAGADTIVLPVGVFKIALHGTGDDTNSTGDFDVIDSVTFQGAGAGATIIDGQQLDRVFDVFVTMPSSLQVVLQGLTIRNGSVAGPGGGIRISDTNLVVRDCAIIGNRASQDGGGISNADLPGTGNVRVVRTTLARNVAEGSGGGLAVEGSSVLTVIDSTFRRNIAVGTGGGLFATTATLTGSAITGNYAGAYSGGVWIETADLTGCTVSGNAAALAGGGIGATTGTIRNCTVDGNSAGLRGGGILGSNPTVIGSTISGNVSGANGGGIYAIGPTIARCTVSGNTASGDGGGIWDGFTNVSNSTISGNSAGGKGGGIAASNSGVIEGCTIVENSCTSRGGGVYVELLGTHVRNTIIALNVSAGIGGLLGMDVNGTFTSDGHNLVGNGDDAIGFTNGVKGDIVGTTANQIDPKLGPLANNGGPTKTHALLAGSPAIDKGDNAGLQAADQRGAGFARKKDGNGDGLSIVDIGAFER